MATMGEMLRAARDQAGLTVEAAASATRIPRHNLIALETDNLDVLPAEPFTRGLIRIYTRTLAVPEEPVLNAYATALNARRYAASAPNRAALRRRRRRGAGMIAVVAVLLAASAGCVHRGLPRPLHSTRRGRASTERAGSGPAAGAVVELGGGATTEISSGVDGRQVFADGAGPDRPTLSPSERSWCERGGRRD